MKNLSKLLVLLLLVAVCGAESGMARSRKKQKTVSKITLTNFPSKAVTEYTFHGGKALLKGALTGYADGKRPKNLTLRVNDVFSRQEQTLLVDVDEQGRFAREVALPHGQFCYMPPVNLFLFPGDTLECVYDAASQQARFIGDNRSAQVSRLWPEWDKHYLDTIEPAWRAAGKEMKQLMNYRNRNIALIDRLAQEVATGTLPLRAQDSVVTDILTAGVWAQALINVMEGKMHYKRNEEAMRAEPLNDSVYYDFLPEREHFLLDNPLLIFEAGQWVLANRAEFELFRPMNELGTWYIRSLGPEILLYASWRLLPKDYSEQFLRNVREQYHEAPYTRSRYYADELEAVRKKLHLGNSFLLQLCLSRDVFDDIRMWDADELTPDYVAELVASALPRLTHPAVCRRYLDAYRRYVVQNEGARTADAETPEADAVLKRITAPYAGNVLLLDFWGIGCGPCRAGMLAQRELVEEMKDQPVKFLYICNEKESPREPSEQFLTSNNIRGEHIYLSAEDWNRLRAKLNFSGIPFYVLIDRDGTLHSLRNKFVDRELFKPYLEP